MNVHVRVQITRPYSKKLPFLFAIRRLVTIAPPYTKKLWNQRQDKHTKLTVAKVEQQITIYYTTVNK